MQKISKRKHYINIIFARTLAFAAVTLIMLLFSTPAQSSAASFAANHGELSVSGTKLVDQKGKTVQLRGVSTHGLSWFPQYVSRKAFQTMRDKWNVNLVRLALYTEEYNGYCTGDAANRKNLETVIDQGVSYAEELGMYVIIDWHILNDANPNTHIKEAKKFFKKMAKKYDGIPNVIFEICNEPNGGTSWSEISSYAKKILKTIRSNQKKSKAIVIVGTPNWSQDVDTASQKPLSDDHVVYAFHFYAATHGSAYRQKVQTALDAGLPVFVSEFGICDASGSGAVNKKEANEWKKFLCKNKISMCAWNLSNKDETSAFLKSSCEKTSGWKNSDLSESGKWIIKAYKKM